MDEGTSENQLDLLTVPILSLHIKITQTYLKMFMTHSIMKKTQSLK